jgi:hypothetical protein
MISYFMVLQGAVAKRLRQRIANGKLGNLCSPAKTAKNPDFTAFFGFFDGSAFLA